MRDEFAQELKEHGRIYGYRFRPRGRIYAKPVDEYQGVCLEAKSLQLMIDNNLDFETALYPYELVTYGETGQVCQNWMQYLLIQKYLQSMSQEQTLVVQSGHPLGVFKSSRSAPRVIISNAMMVGMYNNLESWKRAAAIGVANYGQMTAGGWMYIGPQGIVHGTYNTLLIAGRLKLGLRPGQNLAGKLFVSSGLGGMSGAQGKACKLAGGVAIIAEVDPSRVETRKQQGWVDEVYTDLPALFAVAQEKLSSSKPAAIAYQGNVIDVLEYAGKEKFHMDLISDQTSCHAVYDGGYCPAGMSFSDRTELLQTKPQEFKAAVDQSLQRHFVALKMLVEAGSYFFDYGNSFLKSLFDAGVEEIAKNKKQLSEGFIWPSYVEDFMGPELFDYGYGPFRWVCLSGKDDDLKFTDHLAAKTIKGLRSELRYQDVDNLHWIENAHENDLVVGSKARILYQDAIGRLEIALAMNQAVRAGKVGPIMLGRDHHDTGGTDSPFRETANIRDGSSIMADMAVQSFAGNAARGMTMVALHNGGGVGIGKSVNGGFGMLLDGSSYVDEVLNSALPWDVWCGVTRRAWAGNPNAIEAVRLDAEKHGLSATLPYGC
jgi:urocanate hydratase